MNSRHNPAPRGRTTLIATISRRTSMRKVIIGIIALTVFIFAGGPAARAHHPAPSPDPAMPACDRITGGGQVMGMMVEKANFGFVAGCQKDFWDDNDDDDNRGGNDDDAQRHTRFGHLEYHDKGVGLKLRSKISDYIFVPNNDPTTSGTSKQPKGTRMLCGTTRTSSGHEVDWVVQAADNGEPGRDKDDFIIQVTKRNPAPGD